MNVARKPTYAELEVDVARLTVASDNLWKCLRTERVAHRNQLLDDGDRELGDVLKSAQDAGEGVGRGRDFP